ncbi:MAG: carboxypeptidase-like regulatory domain-containing protein [Planctomycetota bacterium]|nr:carboxypeptidase-like regulatory domain-containing protein [Planctomycetota bacterium]
MFEREVPQVEPSPTAADQDRTLTEAERALDVALDAVFGSVTDSFGTPLVGARVSLRGWRGSLDAELGSAATDHEGRYRIDVKSWPSELAVRRALRRRLQSVTPASPSYWTLGAVQLRLSADLPGYTSATEERVIDAVLGQPLRVDFRLAAGRAVRGRVVRHAEGLQVGVEFADVVFLDGQGNVAARSSTDARGDYTAYLADGTYQLHARRPGVGTALLADAVVDRSRSTWLPSVQLTGTNRMRGKVTYPDGAPAWGLLLQAELASLAPKSFDGLTLLERAELEGSEGLAQSFARTDENGEFEFRALRGGEFQLRVPRVDDTEISGKTLQDSSSLAANLVFHGRRLRVEVLRVDGKGVPEAQLDAWRITDNFELSRENELPVEGFWGGIFTLHVEAGERLFLRAFADGLPYAWRAVQVSSLEYEDTVRILLEEGPQPETGATTDLAEALGASVGIELIGDDDKPLDAWFATATSGHGDTPAGWATALPGFGGLLPPLPPGRFRLSFGALDRHSFRCFETVSTTVTTRFGGSQRLTLRVPTGGRLRFTLPPQSDEGGVEQFVDPEVDIARRGWSATVRPLDGKGDAIALHLQPSDRPDHAGPRALPGAEVEAFPSLLPGRYELRLSRSQSETLTYKVTVRVGEVTTVAQ